MFKRSMILGLILSCPLLAQIQWEGPEPVSSGISPDMAPDPRNGELHVVAVNLFTNPADPVYKDRGVVYTKIDPAKLETDDPTQFTLRREIIPNTASELGLASAAFAGPSIAVDQAGNPHVCYRTPGSGQYLNNIYYTYRTVSGWSSPLTIRINAPRAYAVQMAIDKNNVVHLVHGEAPVVDLSDGTFSYYQIQGNTIIKSQTAIGKYHANDRLAIDVDQDGGVYVLVAPQYPPYEGPIYYYSRGGTNNLERVGDIHSMTAPGRNGGPDVFIDLNKTVHFAYGTQLDSDVNNKGSIRYSQYKNGTFVLDKAVTPASGTGALEAWKDGNGWGLGGVAGSPDGQLVVVAYLTKNIGQLYTVYSLDGGTTWSAPEFRAEPWGILKDNVLDSDGRALQVIRGYQNNIYLVYQTPNNTVRVQYVRKIGEVLPTASAGGPYESFEGTAIAFDASGSADTGMNAGIAKYEWDWERDGVYDINTTQPTIQHTYTDDFTGQVRLRVTDLSGNQATADASVQVRNVAPTVSAGPDQAIDENQSVTLTATVIDPGQDTHTLTWQFSEGGSSSGPSVQRTYLDHGNYTAIVTAQDDDGGMGRDTVNVQVRNVLPIAEAGGPYNGSRNMPIDFLGTATNPGTLNQPIYSWDMDDNGVFETSGNRVRRSWAIAGRYTIWFRVEDDGGVGIDSAVVTITADEPTILPIPDQVIQEGSPFLPLNLDTYVIHPIQTAQQMVWTVTDTMLLSASIINRQLTVNVPNQDWFGEETLTLTVRDLGGFTDVGQVTYKVQNVNDPPYWKQKVPDYAFDEDKSLTVSLSTLRSLVGDIDSPASQFTFSLQGSGTISASLDALAGVMRFSAPQNWNGAEDIQIVVSDGDGGSAIDTSRITVRPIPDAPLSFNIIAPTYLNFATWPDRIACSWERPVDPDGEEISTYLWKLEPYEVSGNPPAIEYTVHETTFGFLPDPTLDDGVWKWTVTAKDEAGLTTRCEQPVYFIKNSKSGVTGSESLPTQLALHQNYPNPFNPETMIHYDLPKEGWIDLSIFNSLGQKIRVLYSGQKQAGIYSIQWNADNDFGTPVPSGIYVCRLKADSQVLYRKMMLVH